MKLDGIPHDRTQTQPPEILSEIFRCVCGDRVVLPPPSNGYPWTLGHVCSRWRQILWDTPSIWDKIVIDTYHDPSTVVIHIRRKPKTIRGYRRRNKYKERTRETLTFILEHIFSPITLTVLQFADNISHIILDNSQRFRILSLADISQDTLFRLLHLPPDAFPLLEKLTLGIYPISSPITGNATSSLQTAPNLRSVTYDTLSHLYVPSLFLLPFSELENLQVKTMFLPPSTIYNIWQFAPCLRSCSFLIGDFDCVSTSQLINIPSLESLELAAFDFDWEAFLTLIKTPSLKNLSIRCSHLPAAPLTSLITRSGCSIRDFGVFERDENEAEMDSGVFHSFFQHLPAVLKLGVSRCLPTSVIWSIRDGKFPNLLSAEFSVYPEAFGALLDMIDSYVDQPHSPGRRLGCFDVFCHAGPGYTDLRERYKAGYKAYEKAEGLSITAFHHNTGALLEEEEFSDGGSIHNEFSSEDDWE